jgi:hypothetical protein
MGNTLDKLARLIIAMRSERMSVSRTTYAVSHGRRTPAEISELLDRSARVIQRSTLLRRRHDLQRLVH